MRCTKNNSLPGKSLKCTNQTFSIRTNKMLKIVLQEKLKRVPLENEFEAARTTE